MSLCLDTMSYSQTDRQDDNDIQSLMTYLLALPFHSLTGIDLRVGSAPHMALVAAGATVTQKWLEPTSSALSSGWTDSV